MKFLFVFVAILVFWSACSMQGLRAHRIQARARFTSGTLSYLALPSIYAPCCWDSNGVPSFRMARKRHISTAVRPCEPVHVCYDIVGSQKNDNFTWCSSQMCCKCSETSKTPLHEEIPLHEEMESGADRPETISEESLRFGHSEMKKQGRLTWLDKSSFATNDRWLSNRKYCNAHSLSAGSSRSAGRQTAQPNMWLILSSIIITRVLSP